MRIFKNKWFNRYARKQRISDDDLRSAVSEMENGLVDANYGGNLFKKRIAKQGEGKSGGHRAIIAYVIEDKAFFMYGFEKSAKDNLEDDEVAAYKEFTKDYLALSDTEISQAVSSGKLIELEV
jgi:hypothetical protein